MYHIDLYLAKIANSLSFPSDLWSLPTTQIAVVNVIELYMDYCYSAESVHNVEKSVSLDHLTGKSNTGYLKITLFFSYSAKTRLKTQSYPI